MKMTLMVKLQPSLEQRDKLLVTMRTFNSACDYIAIIAFKEHTASKFRIQKIVYRDVRERFGLSSQLTVRAIAKVCEAYKRDKNIKPSFKEFGAIVYDQRILGWKGLEHVSLLTTTGREKIPIIIGPYQQGRLKRIRGQADLVYHRQAFYLCVVVEVDEPSRHVPTGFLGVDFGSVILAADSDGELISGKTVDTTRKRYNTIKSALQNKGTHNAKRHLKRLSGRESRFKRNTNHVISKRIVAKAKDTGRGIAIEDLKGVRRQKTVCKAQRGKLHSWSFRQLRTFIEYKAAINGVAVVAVDPSYTSQTCPCCGCIDEKNRMNRDIFVCIKCAFAGHADTIAAINIAVRATVNLPIVPLEFRNQFGSPSGTSPRTLVVGS